MDRIKRIKEDEKIRIYLRPDTCGKFSPASLLRLGVLLFFTVFSLNCGELGKPTSEPFYAETTPPQKKEFRWSNGKMPKSFDPALAVAPPETDVVRALYEGLTDIDPKTLKPVRAIAVDWSSSDDFKTWTFKLRPDARWSNNERVTANDFVRSWKRLAAMGKNLPSYKLLQNIVGMETADASLPLISEEADKILSEPLAAAPNSRLSNKQLNSNTSPPVAPPPTPTPTPLKPQTEAERKNSPAMKTEEKIEEKRGFEALDSFTFKVSLVNPDRDFPALVAHPVFRPIYGDGKEFEGDKLNASIVTSGAFRISSITQEGGITLDRAEHFWDKESVELERVRFVPAENAEKALEAYRKGEIDAVTNADFEPLALKLLAPFDDFRRTPHGALNFYEFNRNKKPFDDRRVREALTIAIERERLTEGDTEGATKPALSFLLFGENKEKLIQDSERAKELLAEAGFPDAEDFPVVRLVVNRNETQQRIARSVAKMWKRNLNVETEIVVAESAEIEMVRAAGDFDVIRRGEVLPTSDETANMMMIFPPQNQMHLSFSDTKTSDNSDGKTLKEHESVRTIEADKKAISENKLNGNPASANLQAMEEKLSAETADSNKETRILTEAQAIAELPAIPLYFPTSYSLVKPYIRGFEMNILDAPSLKDVKIDFNWQPKKPDGES